MYGVIMAEIAFSDALKRLADEAEDRLQLRAARAEDDYVPWDEVKTALISPARPKSPE